MRKLLHPVCFIIILFASSWAIAADYKIVDLGNLGEFNNRTFAINDSGQVVGYVTAPDGNRHAFVYENGSMIDIGDDFSFSVANDINNYGQVVGAGIDEYGPTFFMYDTADESMISHINSDLNSGNGNNDQGQIVGDAWNIGQAFIYDVDENDYTFIPPSFGGDNAGAVDINDSGYVVGWSNIEFPIAWDERYAFLYDPDTKATINLGTLGGNWVEPNDINNEGQVVGRSCIIPGETFYSGSNGGICVYEGFLYEDGEMISIGRFPNGSSSAPMAINDLGQVVGRAIIEPDTTSTVTMHAFLYENGTMLDLNDVNYFSIDGIEDWDFLLEAADINNFGQIAGTGVKDGIWHPYILTPLPIADAGGPYLVEIGEQVQFDGSGSYDGYGSIFSYEWNLGDDTVFYEENPSHVYNEAGVYNVSLTVVNDRGVESIGTGQSMVVVYDPCGGFVTGGGWFWSEQGAYAEFPALEGRAQFGFVSKYKKGEKIPTGKLDFRFKAGDLNFYSESYDWLVVAGPQAKYKGVGTINGEGNYGFMITAVDAALTPSTDVDLFRIKIWDIDTGDVVYDNQIDADEDADPTTAIGGGSIVIHKDKDLTAKQMKDKGRQDRKTLPPSL